jgi:NAD(P)-dependent dehydrogenase (short-subunit alcohol dehydrogenase family)
VFRRKSLPRSLRDKVVAITGGARGIGYAISRALAREGARIAIGDLDGNLAAQVAGQLCVGSFGVPLDVTDNAAYTSFLDEVERRLGPIDVLINNAGIMTAGAIELEPEHMTAREIAINLGAVIHGTREAVRRMKPRRTGHIINISSAIGKVAGAGVATYSATKFGVAGFSESVALELQGTGVEISAVFPPQCKTEMTSGMKTMRGMPFIEPEDVAARVVETLRHPVFEVPVPKSIGRTLWLIQALPFRARAALARATKADVLVREMDPTEHAAYAERLSRMTAAPTQRHPSPVPATEDKS